MIQFGIGHSGQNRDRWGRISAESRKHTAAYEQNCCNTCVEQTSSQIARSVPGCLSFQMKGDTRSLLCLQAAAPGAGCSASRKHPSLLSDTDCSGIRRVGEIRIQLSPASDSNTDLSHQLHHVKPWLEQGRGLAFLQNINPTGGSCSAFLSPFSGLLSILVLKKKNRNRSVPRVHNINENYPV